MKADLENAVNMQEKISALYQWSVEEIWQIVWPDHWTLFRKNNDNLPNSLLVYLARYDPKNW